MFDSVMTKSLPCVGVYLSRCIVTRLAGTQRYRELQLFDNDSSNYQYQGRNQKVVCVFFWGGDIQVFEDVGDV